MPEPVASAGRAAKRDARATCAPPGRSSTHLDADGTRTALERAGVSFVVDTCVVVTPILDAKGGVMMTNSAKFAHYGPANTGYDTVFGSLADCVETAVAGTLRAG